MTDTFADDIRRAEDGEHPLVALNELRMKMGKEPLLHLPKWGTGGKVCDDNPLARGIGGKAFSYGDGDFAVLVVKSFTQVPGFDAPYRWADNDYRCEKVVGRTLAQLARPHIREVSP